MMFAETTASSPSRHVHRAAVGLMFFLQGLCFASWASRIPSIQGRLGLSEAALGGALLALPAGSMTSLPFAGALVARWGSRRVVLAALGLYGLTLVGIGAVGQVPALLGVLYVFGIAGNLVNISVNTQAVGVEALYGRSVMASFHGLWSLAGFTAAAVGTAMMGRGVAPLPHFLGTLGVLVAGMALGAGWLLPDAPGRGAPGRLVSLPHRSLWGLGVMAFCCMICEGTMFDWSGVYFQRVVHAPPARVGLGYAVFMAFMATGRFLADGLVRRLGLRRVFQLSGALIATGLLVAVGLPRLGPALGGFVLVGLGVSSVVPLVYGAAGRGPTGPAGVAIAAVSTIGFLGFLVGPPLIGFVAEAVGLRAAFALIACLGLGVAVLGSTKEFPAPG